MAPTRLGVERVLTYTAAFGALCALSISLLDVPFWLLQVIICGVGMGIGALTAAPAHSRRTADRWRLVVRRGGANGGTVEVAHEALFREWPQLNEWLEPERVRLDALRALEVDAAAWVRNGRDRNFLNHRDERLADAQALTSVDAFRKRITPPQLDYLAACRAVERLVQRQRLRQRILIGALTVSTLAGILLWKNKEFAAERWHWWVDVVPYRNAHIRPYVLTQEGERALNKGQSFKECDTVCPDMVVIPAGNFSMGSPKNEIDRWQNEGPQHDVTIATPFAVSKYEVTFDDWQVCVDYGNCDPCVDDSGFGHGRQPVINVSWYDVKRYVAWLSRMTGKTYRLLSEAEYEYAARAGTHARYPWGDKLRPDEKTMANCLEALQLYTRIQCGSEWDGKKPAPVGKFPPNQFGLYDMVGNIWEWVEDCDHEDYEGAPNNGDVWLEQHGGNCEAHMARGGAFDLYQEHVRAARRGVLNSLLHSPDVGFRVARSLF